MKRIGGQNYIVARGDFPMTVEVEGFDLAVFQCVPSEVIVTRPDDSVITTFDLPIAPDKNNPLLGRLTIPDPGDPATPLTQRFDPSADATFTFVVGYDTPGGKDPRYEIRLTPAAGDSNARVLQPPIRRVTTRLIYR